MTHAVTTQSVPDLVLPEQRIQALDILRGFAVLGILWINILIFGLPSGAYALPSYIGDSVAANIRVWLFSEVMIDGAMRGLFSCLFGASAMLYMSEAKLQVQGVMRVEYYYRRNLILIAIGLFHAYVLLWPYEVLYAYGLFGLFLFPLRRVRPWLLLTIGCLMIVAYDLSFYDSSANQFPKNDPVRQVIQNAQTTEPETSDGMDPFELDKLTKPAEVIDEKEEYRETAIADMQVDITLHLSSYRELFRNKLATTLEQQTLSMVTMHLYDIGGMMLLGMALFQLGVLQGQRSRRFYFWLMLCGFVIGIAIRAPLAYLEIVKDFVPDDLENPEAVNYGFSRLPIMLGYIGLVLLLYKSRLFSSAFRLLAATGKMALTHYISQTVICIFLFYGFGFGLIGAFEHYQLILICMLIWILQMGFSVIWLRHYRYGPLEWLWRSAMYWQWQPMKSAKVKIEEASV